MAVVPAEAMHDGSVDVSMGTSAGSTMPGRGRGGELGPCPGSKAATVLQVVEPDLGRNGRGGESTPMAKERPRQKLEGGEVWGTFKSQAFKGVTSSSQKRIGTPLL